MVPFLVASLLAAMPAPEGSIRQRKPATATVGLGYPDLLHADVSYTFLDRVTVGAGAGVSLGGGCLRLATLWHALASSTHGHSLLLGPSVIVFPGGAFFGGPRPLLITHVLVGWEWRSQVGLTLRLAAGPGAFVDPVLGSASFEVGGRFDLGLSFQEALSAAGPPVRPAR